MSSGNTFRLINENKTKKPHEFSGYKYDSGHLSSWLELIDSCLSTWRITAKAYRKEILLKNLCTAYIWKDFECNFMGDTSSTEGSTCWGRFDGFS